MTKKERKTMLECYRSRYIAHRGLFDNSKDAPENTILAFKRAVDAGYGIELDVQLSKDKHVVVAHDYDLKRICGHNKAIKDLSYKELIENKIFNSAESIPLFTDVLQVINGKVPLIVEIKTEEEYKEICTLTDKILSAYTGTYCVESFSPFVVNWYKINRPEIIRGQLADDFLFKKRFKSKIKNYILTNMVYNAVSKPDFIAYNHQFKNKKILQFWKKILGCNLAAWTIKSQKELDDAMKIFDIIIFDSFIPK
jgi:glycerophosphoryl diester phosphodiesterase